MVFLVFWLSIEVPLCRRTAVPFPRQAVAWADFSLLGPWAATQSLTVCFKSRRRGAMQKQWAPWAIFTSLTSEKWGKCYWRYCVLWNEKHAKAHGEQVSVCGGWDKNGVLRSSTSKDNIFERSLRTHLVLFKGDLLVVPVLIFLRPAPLLCCSSKHIPAARLKMLMFPPLSQVRLLGSVLRMGLSALSSAGWSDDIWGQINETCRFNINISL